ncbi:IS66 family transposase [Nitrosomonas mobilis]|uniref:Transposase n=4 Tax=Nitrosomonas mobilis TaxID=51642 RepID=A0A1G5SBT9_9PROT|nr:IS66 family transposase [Nitrosomonas mobilis]SCZ84674.1 transposase [Nitrosomonas mobilis]
MASLDKTSVRDEVSRLKADFDRLGSEGKLSSESQAIMNSLFMIVELILAIFLERSTKKDSGNSSKPSSQTLKDESALSHPGSNGKGKSENKDQAGNMRVNEIVTISPVLTCEVCAQDLSGVPCVDHERRTRIDIVFEKVIDHVDAEIKRCPACDSTVKGVFPPDMHGPLQYGDGLKAFVINLLIGQMVALNRVQKLVKSMIGTVIAEATLLKFVLRLHQALANWEQQTTEKILHSPAINVDETSFRVDMKNYWIHVYSSNDLTLKFLHRNRGKTAVEVINIIPRYGGAIIHDCWPTYLSYPHCSHGLCGSHLLRELTFIVDTHDYAWACNMKRMLQETCKEVSQSTEKRLSDKAFANLQKRYRNILTHGKKELPVIPPKSSGKRGKLAKSDAHNLWERLKIHEAAVLLFAKNPHVSFTNNRAERDLRMSKVKQKVSGCFRVSEYAHAYCRISSYLQSMANKGYNPLVAIQIALAGEAHKVWGE